MGSLRRVFFFFFLFFRLGPKGPGVDYEDAERPSNLGLLQTALAASSDRVSGELSGLLQELAERVVDGSDMQAVVQAIQALPPLDPRFAGAEDVAAVLDRNDLHLLRNALRATSQRVVGELSSRLLELGEHFATGSPELGTIVKAIEHLPMHSNVRDICLTNSVGVNTLAPMVLPSKDSHEHGQSTSSKAELSRMRASLDAELQAAREEAERQRLRAEEAMRKLDEEARKAESIIKELRDKLRALEALLQRAGLGKEAAAALAQVGLKDFIAGRDVFERLYRDALRRMRVYAETQLQLLNRSGAAFLQTLHDLAAYPLGAVEAALELQRGQLGQAPLSVMGYAPAALRSNRSSPASSPKNTQQPRRVGEPTRQHLQRVKTVGVGRQDLRPKEDEVQTRFPGRRHSMRRAATESSALCRGMPIRTLRQTLFEGLPEQRPAQQHAEANDHGRMAASQTQAHGNLGNDHPSDQGLHSSSILSISAMGPRPAASQLLPRPGTGHGQRSPAIVSRSLPVQRPTSSGGRAKEVRIRSGAGEAQIHPSLHLQSRSF